MLALPLPLSTSCIEVGPDKVTGGRADRNPSVRLVYGSVCSGIEAATAAWHPLGWRASFFSEIEAFPRAVLAHHYPDVLLHGDFTTIESGQYEPIDLLVGGTPCQSFSVAGLRGGLADDRGNLALEFLRLAQRLGPRWLVWENVPGVLSSGGGRDFGSILGGMGELGYGVAYRVLDAQHFGVPQRRRRVFVVGYLGDWRRAAAVLFERESLSGISAPYVEDPSYDIEWWRGKNRRLNCIDAGYGRKWGSNQWYARGHVIVDGDRPRRATPLEVERAFGFPDRYTAIPGATDDRRYKALGNSMAVPCMAWIGRRIQMVESLFQSPAVALPGNATGLSAIVSLPGAEGGFVADQKQVLGACRHAEEIRMRADQCVDGEMTS